MSLRVLTTGLMLFGLAALFAMPIVLGPRPEVATEGREAVRQYAINFGVYTIILTFVWLAVIVCAWLIVKAVRNELRETAASNMKVFLEGTLQDHKNQAERADSEVVEDDTERT